MIENNLTLNYGNLMPVQTIPQDNSFDLKRYALKKALDSDERIIEDQIDGAEPQAQQFNITSIQDVASGGLGMSSMANDDEMPNVFKNMRLEREMLAGEQSELAMFQKERAMRDDLISDYELTTSGYHDLGSENITPASGPGAGAYVLPHTGSIKSSGGIFVPRQRVNGKWYNSFTKTYGTKATRNFNPGNITGAGGKLLYGAKKIATAPLNADGDHGDAKQLVFGSPKEGWRAMRALMSSKRYNNAPIKHAFSKWQSNQKAWTGIKNEMSRSGIDINRRFVDLPLGQQLKMMQIRANHEGYNGPRVSSSMFS